jgi:hypothetical protein
MLPSLGFSCPTARARPADPLGGDRSLCRRVPRAGFGYPLRDVHHRPCRRIGAGALLGFTLQGVLLDRAPYPSRGLCPLDVAGPDSATPGGSEEGRAAFRALSSRRVRAVTGLPGESGRRCLPGFLPSRAFPPSARAIACSHDADPLALGREDVITRLGLRVSRIGWIGLVRLRTAGSPGVLHLPTGTALRSSARGAGVWVCLTTETTRDAWFPNALDPLGSDAAVNPRLTARRRRPSVLD